VGVKKRAIESMTGFGAGEISVPYWGKISCELRSTNHKFLEMILHLPEGYLSLEERVKNEVESRLKRGRVVCVITVMGSLTTDVSVNESLVKGYVNAIRGMGKKFSLKDDLGVSTLINLPGVFSTSENKIAPSALWIKLKKAVDGALDDLSGMRVKEGKRLVSHLSSLAAELVRDLRFVDERFKKSISDKMPMLKSDVERTVFLKDIDITEELERLGYHIGNLTSKLRGSGPVGKELDFICQEMQREANTMGAKSSDTKISGKVVQMKSTIEKMREQVQNIE
jgi:uncharacterized protein (TIGR00255 family)